MSRPEHGLASVGQTDVLRVDDVRAGYGSVSVLEGVSLHLRDGEAVTVLGPNGAGKTTLLRVISGIVPARSGRIETGAARNTPHSVARAGIGHVPEGRGIFPGLSVADNLALGSFGVGKRNGGERAERTMALVLDLFPWIEARMKQAAGTLSGGEQQMLAIGRALLSNPRVLLLDEPSLGLSPLMVNRVFEALEQIRARNVAILVVEQNLTHALALADRGYVMNRGRIVLEGSAEQLRQSDMFSHYLATS
jgi:branched-chain amino acid transport system ATP-binding protein